MQPLFLRGLVCFSLALSVPMLVFRYFAFTISLRVNTHLKLVLLGAGVFLATANRVGNVSSWSDVGKHFKSIETRCFPVVSNSLKLDENKATFWNYFVDSMFSVCIASW